MLLHNKADKINLIRGLTAPFPFFLPYYLQIPTEYQIICYLTLFVVISDINHILHLHIHRPFTTYRTVNLLLDIAMGLTTAMTASNWRIQHKHGHHNKYVGEFCPGHNWEMEKYSIKGALSYSARTIIPIFYLPIIESFNKGIINNQTRPINYRLAFLEQISFVVILTALFCYNPEVTISWTVPVYVIVLFTTRYTDYLNHFGCTIKKYEVSNNCLNKYYNFLGNNFGYHTAHHLHGGAHWTELPLLHDEIKNHVPAHQLKTYSWSGYAIPYHFYPSLKGKM